jgi:staphylococcal nuclease domain-containing protein 1
LDTYGAFIGQLFIEGKDLGKQLIEKGYARIHAPSLKKLPIYNEYKIAEDTAREHKLGLWEFFDFEAEKQTLAQDLETRTSKPKPERDSYPIAVTDVRSGCEFSFQKLSNADTSSLESLSANLQSEQLAPHPNPKVHDIVAAQFTVDDLWYRAEIIGGAPKGSKDQTFEVRYMDYGNRESLPVNRIRQLPDIYLTLVEPQAKDAKLYYVRSPPLDSEFGRDSMAALRESLWEKVLYAEEMRTDKAPGPKKSDKEHISLYHLIVHEDNKDLNKTLIRNGNAKVEKMSKKLQEKLQDPYYAALVELQKEAHSKRLGIWQYGDDPEDDEPERL